MRYLAAHPTSAVLIALVLAGCGEGPNEGATSGQGGFAAANAGGGSSSGGSSGAGGAAPRCAAHVECTDAARPYCDATTGACSKPPLGGALGWGDGSPASVKLEVVYQPTFDREATDLEFHPTRTNELWITHREHFVDGPCTAKVNTACKSLEGSVSILTGVGTSAQKATWKKDPNGFHFMRRPAALAFGANDTFATCGEYRTGNYTDETADFIGPTLWSSDPTTFAVQPPGGNGSHLDMLHNSPFAVGIAHERDNVYWVFNGNAGSLDRYDFRTDHGPGNADHSDGEVYRYGEGNFLRVPETPGHVAYAKANAMVFIADTGNKRIARLDPSTAKPDGTIVAYEPMAVKQRMTGAAITDVVPPGTLDLPSGLELRDDVLYVSDAATSRLLAFTLDGKLLRSLDTGLPPGSLAGVTLSADGAVYFVEKPTSRVYRVVPLK